METVFENPVELLAQIEYGPYAFSAKGPNPTKEFSDAVGTYGVLQPLLIHVDENGDKEFIAGTRRIKAAIETQRETVPVQYVTGLSKEERAAWRQATNIYGRNNIALALDSKALIEQGKTDLREISKVLGVAYQKVAQCSSLLILPSDLLEYAGQGKISESVAFSLAKMSKIEWDVARKLIESGQNLTPKAMKALKQTRAAEAARGMEFLDEVFEDMPEPEKPKHFVLYPNGKYAEAGSKQEAETLAAAKKGAFILTGFPQQIGE